MVDENDDDDIDLGDSIELDEFDDESGTRGKRKLLFILIGVGLLLSAAGGGYMFMSGSEETETAENKPETLADSAEEMAASAAGNAIPVYYDVPEFLVDLNSSDRRKSSFLKMKVAIELEKQADVEILEAYMPRVRDNFITYLRELRASDLSGSAGLYRLREELMLRINQAIAPAKVSNILFREIVVQ